MQLDYEQLCQQLQARLGRVVGNERAHVDAYIKAYYMSEQQLHDWLSTVQHAYTPRQLQALIDSAAHLSRKTRAALALQLSNAGGGPTAASKPPLRVL
jgi:hypothetical protein